MRKLGALRQAGLLAVLGGLAVVLWWEAEWIGRTQSALVETEGRLAETRAEVAQVTREDPPCEQIVLLPEDGQVYHVSLLLHEDWRRRPSERALVAWFNVDSRLSSLRAQTHFHLYTQKSSIYRSRLQGAAPVLPAVLIQDGSGKVHFKLSEQLPGTPNELCERISKEFGWRPIYIFPWRRPGPCPGPQPTPEPKPEPVPDDELIVDAEIPDTSASMASGEPEFPWLVAVLVVAAAAGVTLWVNLKRELK
jgi:hypothetical protein